MTKCYFCQQEVRLPYQCNYCGQNFCYEHRLPPNHNCPNIREWKSWSRSSFRTGEKIRSWKAGGEPVEPIRPKREEDGLPKRKDYKKPHRLGRIVKVSITRTLSGIPLSFLGIVLTLSGIIIIGTKVGLFSLPWIEGWGEIFILFIPISLLIGLVCIAGGVTCFGLVLHNNTTQGCIVLLVSVITFYLMLTLVFPNVYRTVFWRGEDGEQMEELVKSEVPFLYEEITVGADGHRIWLHNNPDAKNPTWEELLLFLQQDTTNQIPYSYSSFVCADYAETLHNNAEKADIRVAYVSVELSDVEHALNAFRTTDRGLVFIDCTGYDCKVDVVVGRNYIPVSLFTYDEFYPMGIIDSYEVQW